MIVSLLDLKSHLRVDFDDDDGVISSLAQAAELEISNWIGRPIYASTATLPLPADPQYSPVQIVATPAVLVAVKIMVSRMYENLSGEGNSSDDAVPLTSVRSLLSGLRVFHEAP